MNLFPDSGYGHVLEILIFCISQNDVGTWVRCPYMKRYLDNGEFELGFATARHKSRENTFSGENM